MALTRFRWKDPKTGVDVANAYARISSILLGKVSENIRGSEGWRLVITVHVWASDEARKFESHPDPKLVKTYLAERHFTTQPLLDGDGNLLRTDLNIIEQAYDHLKLQEEFSGARDA